MAAIEEDQSAVTAGEVEVSSIIREVKHFFSGFEKKKIRRLQVRQRSSVGFRGEDGRDF